MDDYFDGLGTYFEEYLPTEDSDDEVEDLQPTVRARYELEAVNYWQQIPVPEDLAPHEPGSLSGLTDDEILNVPVSLLCHILRTEASDGIQVISPRQTPLVMCAGRVDLPKRTADMCLVGSRASRDTDWPTIDGFATCTKMPDEPLDAGSGDTAIRRKTKLLPLVTTRGQLDDPIVKAFLRGKALCDLMRRPDVSGDAEAMGDMLSGAWGMNENLFSGTTDASIAPVGPLLRYAISTDNSYPYLSAPMHARTCLSVAAPGQARTLYGEDSALDWRRIRVLCEAVFYLSSRAEGVSLVDLSSPHPPGDPTANPRRSGILQFRPLPGVVWSFAPLTFRMTPGVYTPTGTAGVAVLVPRVSSAVDMYMGMASPIAVAQAASSHTDLVPTRRTFSAAPGHDSIVAGYLTVMRTMHARLPRGRYAAAALRDTIYDHFVNSSETGKIRALWLVSRVRKLASELGVPISRDFNLVREMAARFDDVASDVRARLAYEVARRSTTLEEWWGDIKAVLPAELERLSEGTGSWALAMAWLVLNPPTDKWSGLSAAMRMSSIRKLACAAPEAIRLPARIGSSERVVAAMQATCRTNARNFSAYYSADAEGCYVLSRSLSVASDPKLSTRLRAAGRMWSIRASAAATMRVVETTAIREHERVLSTRPTRTVLKTSPYAAYVSWLQYARGNKHLDRNEVASFPTQVDGHVSLVFSGHEASLAPDMEPSRALRYLCRPSMLHEDIEKTLRECAADVSSTGQLYSDEGLEQTVENGPIVLLPGPPLDLSSLAERPPDVYDILAEMDYSDCMYYTQMFEGLDDMVQDDLMTRGWASPAQLISVLAGLQDIEARSKEAIH